MTTYQQARLPETGIRATLRIDDRNIDDAAARFGPTLAYRLACRTFDSTIDSDAGRMAIWAAVRGPEAAIDAANANRVDADWVQRTLARRSAYLGKIAKMLGLGTTAASRAQHDDLEPVPDGTIDPRIKAAVTAGVRESLAEAAANASKSERAHARSARRRS